MDTFERVKNLVVEQLGVNEDQVTPEASFTEDLGADSPRRCRTRHGL